eukprot:CCRYP_008484-RA/>CCRYP_008484-RA protein AED:0.21 eAED:0.21 QI:573/1/0.5/1/0/0/2/0/182
MTTFRISFFKQRQPSRETTSEPERRGSIKCPPQESQPGLVPCRQESLVRQTNDHARGHDILEDWPQRGSGLGRSSIRSMNKHKQVTIAQFSKVRRYAVDESTAQQSYSSKDRKVFQEEAAREAIRIRKLMAMCPHGYNMGGKATVYLIQHNLLSVEEMIGIENLISDASAKNSLIERRLHTA